VSESVLTTAPAVPATTVTEAPDVIVVRRPALGPALLSATRPRQWVKNLLVVAAPLAAGRWLRSSVEVGAALAFLAITLSAAGTYLLNDVHDIERDRWHPVKRLRPVAAGRLSVRAATAAGVVLLVAGPVLALATGRPLLAVAVAAYAALSVSYSRRLKSIAWLEILVVAAGFVIRPLAGAAATGVRPSPWFLAVCCSGALMVTLGKRNAELALPDAVRHRPVLARYRPAAMRVAGLVATAGLIGGYLAWAGTRPRDLLPAALVSAAAVTVAALRYRLVSDRGRGGEPERLLFHDRVLQACAIVWLVAFLAGPGH
jgi:decaprenyl-phosphate phosphoribosyltransferase